MTINIDSFEQSRARLQLQPIPKCVGSASPNLWVGGPGSPGPWFEGSVSPDPSGAAPGGSPYRRQPLWARKYNPRSNF